MSIKHHWSGAAPAGARSIIAVALATTLIAALPTAPATASLSTTATIEIPSGDLGSVFETVPVTDLGLTNEQLGQVLSKVNGLEALSSSLQSVVSNLLTSNPNATVGQLVDAVLANGQIANALHDLGLDPEQILAELDPSELSTLLGNLPATLSGDQLATLLSGLSGKLSASQLESLQSVLEPVASILASGELAELQADLTSLLSGLGDGEVTSVLNSLKSTMSGAQLAKLESLVGNLNSLNPNELQTQLQALLKGLSATQLSGLLSTLLGKLEPSTVQPALSDLLGDLPLSPTDAGSLAGKLGTSVETLAGEVGTTLTSTTPALVAPLGEEGAVLSVLSDPNGLKLSMLNPESAAGGSGGKGGSGGNGANGSTTADTSGSAAAPTTAPVQTVTIVPPATAGAASTKTGPAKTLTKIRILSQKVKGDVARIVLQIPSAGKVSVRGAHVATVTRTVGKAERVTIRVKLTRAGVASLKRHRKLLRVRLKAVFSPHSGPASSAVTSVRFV